MASNKSGTKGLEIELKYLLSRQDYRTLIRNFRRKICKTVYHTNIYFDDSKLRLRKKHIGLRVRFLNGNRAIVTLKHPAKKKTAKVPSLKIRHEYEEEIPYRLAKKIIRRRAHLRDLDILPMRVLKRFYDDKLISRIRPLGAVETVRTFVKHRAGLELELDKFEMFRQKHYELEVETEKPKQADASVRELFRELGIPYHPITKSKLGRFIQEWRRRRA